MFMDWAILRRKLRRNRESHRVGQRHGVAVGMTTAFPPNTIVPYVRSGRQYDIDFTASRLGTRAGSETISAESNG